MDNSEHKISEEYKKNAKEWNEGFNKGESDYEAGIPLLPNDAKCNYKAFDWIYLAYQDGYVEGYLYAKENDYKTTL